MHMVWQGQHITASGFIKLDVRLSIRAVDFVLADRFITNEGNKVAYKASAISCEVIAEIM